MSGEPDEGFSSADIDRLYDEDDSHFNEEDEDWEHPYFGGDE